MTQNLMTLTASPQPDFVAPFVVAVTHPEGPEASGKVFVVGAGYVSEIRWERSKGAIFKTDASFTPSAVGPHIPGRFCDIQHGLRCFTPGQTAVE